MEMKLIFPDYNKLRFIFWSYDKSEKKISLEEKVIVIKQDKS